MGKSEGCSFNLVKKSKCEMAAVRNQVDEQVRSFNALLSDDVGKFNKMAADTGANTLYAGPAIALRDVQTQRVTFFHIPRFGVAKNPRITSIFPSKKTRVW